MKMRHTNKDGAVTEISLEVTDVDAGNPKLVVTLPPTGNSRDYAKGGKEHWKKELVADAFARRYRYEYEHAFQLVGDPSQPGNTLTFNPLVAAGFGEDFYYIRANHQVVNRINWPDFMQVAVETLETAGFIDPEQQRREQPRPGESTEAWIARITAQTMAQSKTATR